MCEFVKKNCVSKNSLSLLKYEEPLGNRNGSKTEETMLFCFFVVLPPKGQIGLTKLLDSEGQSICLLRLTLCSFFIMFTSPVQLFLLFLILVPFLAKDEVRTPPNDIT